MSKICKFKEQFCSYMKGNKKLSIVIISVFLIMILGWGLFLAKDTILKNMYLQVSSANFDLNIKKLPSNATSIDLFFDTEIDATNPSSILSISPDIKGELKIEGNKLSYILPKGALKKGQDYSIFISKDLKDISGKTLQKDLFYILQVVGQAGVAKVIPDGQLENLGSNMSVFFGIPMVSLTDLSTRDKFPCPIEITPKLEGTCKWTTTSLVEFVPNNGFVGATKYDYKILSKPGLNFEFETYSGTIITSELSVNIGDTFVPKDNININFNFPVSIEELKNHLTLSGTLRENLIVENVEKSETSFILRDKTKDFLYNNSYEITISKGLKPKYGNIPLRQNFTKTITTTGFLSNTAIYQNIYSSTGEIVDTRYIDYKYQSSNEYDYSYLPNKDIFFNLSFYEEIALDKSQIEFVNTKTKQKIDFDLEYKKIEQEEKTFEKTIKDDKNTLKLTLKDPLETNSEYNLIIKKSSNKSLKEDVIMTYHTAPKLEIKDFVFIDYSKSCLYVNNSLDLYKNEGNNYNISLSNSGILKDIFAGRGYINDYKLSQDLEKLSLEERNKKLLENGYCGDPKEGEILYTLETRLHPNTTYSLDIKEINDKYGNNLKSDYSKNFTTKNLKEIDKYVYVSFNNDINLFPKDVKKVVNIQAINTDKVDVSVCLMNDNDYMYYLVNRNETKFVKKCSLTVDKALDTKLVYWNLTNNRYDLEDDILGEKMSYDHVYLTFKAGDKVLTNIINQTDLNLYIEKAENKSLLFATTLKDNNIVSDLKLEFYDFNGKKTTVKYSFDKTKNVYVLDNSLTGIGYIVASSGELSGFLDLGSDSMSNYDFKYISGNDSSTRDYAYIYSDRPIYRPGDTMYIKGIVRKFEYNGYKKSDFKNVVLNIKDEKWETYRSIDLELDKNSNFKTEFIIPSDSSLGNFSFELRDKSDNYIYSYGGFSIEEYKKPIFKVELRADKNNVYLGDKLKIDLGARYYFGANMPKSKGTYTITTQNYFFDAKEYSDFNFGEGNNYFDCVYWGYCNYDDSLQVGETHFETDENGKFSLDYTMPTSTGSEEKIYNFNFDLSDNDTQKTVSNTISRVLHTTNGYVGLKTKYYNKKEDGIYFEAITLDNEAKVLPNKDIKVEVYKSEYQKILKKGVDGVFYNEYSQVDTLDNTYDFKTDDKGQFKYNLKTKDDGEYFVKVSYTGDNGKTFTSKSYTYVSGDDYISWGNDNNSITELESEKITYKLGETASFLLKSPVNSGKVLFVVEKDNGIIDYFVKDITDYTPKFELKINENHYPNVYLKAYLIGNIPNNPLPVYKRALGVAKVVTEFKKLNISIIPDKSHYIPAEKMKVKIEVLDANGKVVPKANGSLSIVDESVLALKGNPKKNPYAFFYDMKRYLGVESILNLKFLVEKLEVKDVSDGEKGGAGETIKGGDTKKLRGNFKDTAYYQADFTTDDKGIANIDVGILPDNLTTWVLEALVNTPDNKIGVNYTSVYTSKQVMLEDNLPRFFLGDDKIILSPVVYNKTGKNGNFEVSVLASSGTITQNKKTVFIKSGESSRVDFEYFTKKTKNISLTDSVKITFEAVSKENPKLQDGLYKILPLYYGYTKESVATVGQTDSVSFSEKIDLSNIDKTNASLKINYSATLFTYILDSIDYLSSYPYGCAEQRTSAIMPSLYIKNLYESVGKTYDLKNVFVDKYIDDKIGYKKVSIDEAIKDYLSIIGKFQNTDGGFMYWYDTEYKYSNLYLTNYILSSLGILKDSGYKVDNNILKNAAVYLQTQLELPTCKNYGSTSCITIDEKIDILLSLLDYKKDDIKLYNIYKTLDLKDINSIKKADLISQIANIQTLDKEVMKNLQKDAKNVVEFILKNSLVINPRGAYITSDNNSRLYNTSYLLKVLSQIGLDEFKDIDMITSNMIRFISSNKSDYLSTYDNAFKIKFLTNYIKNSNLKETSFDAQLLFNEKIIDKKTINSSNLLENFSKELTLTDVKDQNDFSISKSGKGKVYYDLSMTYFVPSKNISSRDEGFFVETSYFSYDEFKKIKALKREEYDKYLSGEIVYDELKYKKDIINYLTPLKEFKVGNLVFVYNKIITSEDRDQVAIEAYIPSGTEIINTRLKTENAGNNEEYGNINFDRKEVRDDRWFGFIQNLYTGIYEFNYILRPTHEGIFQVKPTRVGEFYTPEVFGRSAGSEVKIAR